MAKTKKQITQISIAVASAVLIVVWLCIPGWESGKILGIIAAVLLILSMTLSYMEEEKKKSKKSK
ncbi:MAG: hypothetical protein Q4F39_06325 [Bacteroidia bacterium]|nr:hypothetical protein [Bacteroidia bacterium]